MKHLTSNKKKGISCAFGVLFAQGLEAVLIPLLLFSTPLVAFNQNLQNVYGASLLASKEFVAIIMSVIVFGPRLFINAMKKLKQKEAWFFVLAGFFGTGFGNLAFVMGVILAGSSWGVLLTAFYPVFVILLNKVFFREKDYWKSTLGIIISVLSGILLVSLPPFFSDNEFEFNAKHILGIACGGLAGLFWAIEGLLLKVGSTKLKNITIKEMIFLRGVSSTVFAVVFYLPLSMLFGNRDPSIHNAFSRMVLFKIFADPKSLSIIIALGVNLVLLRKMHMYAIVHAGQKLTGIIDTNNFIIPAVFALFMHSLPNPVGKQFDVYDWWLFILIIPLSIGLCMTVYYHKPIVKKQ